MPGHQSGEIYSQYTVSSGEMFLNVFVQVEIGFGSGVNRVLAGTSFGMSMKILFLISLFGTIICNYILMHVHSQVLRFELLPSAIFVDSCNLTINKMDSCEKCLCYRYQQLSQSSPFKMGWTDSQ